MLNLSINPGLRQTFINLIPTNVALKRRLSLEWTNRFYSLDFFDI